MKNQQMMDTAWVVMALLLAFIVALNAYVIFNSKPLEKTCIDGIIMVKQDNVWVQPGLFPEHCAPVDSPK